jgi:hypothetical protein
MRIIDLDGVALDGNALLSFQVHIVQYLRLHIPFGYGMGHFEKTVCQGTFTMVDMGDNAKIPNILHEGDVRLFCACKCTLFLPAVPAGKCLFSHKITVWPPN